MKGPKKPPSKGKKGTKTRSRKLVTRASRPASTSVALSQADPLLQAYIREIQKYPILTREEEHEVAIQYFETKDRAALQKLVTSNLRFVVKIAYEYLHYRMRLLDLIQEGNMGLVKAVEDFNPYKDVRLTTYAVWWIRSYIQDAVLKNFSLVKMGTTQAQKRLFYRLRAEQKKLEQMGLIPQQNVKLLASKLDVREKDIQEMDQRLAQNDLSLNSPLNSEEKQEHLSQLKDPSIPIDEALGETEQKEIFKKILGDFSRTLEGREKLIFQQRLISEAPLTLQEIGDKYGITKERARQVEEQIKSKLLSYVKEHFPDYKILAETA